MRLALFVLAANIPRRPAMTIERALVIGLLVLLFLYVAMRVL
jgi:hypothetical protein